MNTDRISRLLADLPRQTPGSDAITQDALRRLKPFGLPDDPRVLDMGCGEGRTTLLVGRVTGGRVLGVDLSETALDAARRRVADSGLGRRIEVERRSMAGIDGPPGAYGLIWAEGSISAIGFATGLERWRPLLRPHGLMGVSELCWLTVEPPAAARDHWATAYPAMAGVAANRATAERLGYRVLDTITLPPSAWWDEYYGPLEARIAEFRADKGQDPAWAGALDALQADIDLYRAFGSSYGQVFFLLMRRE